MTASEKQKLVKNQKKQVTKKKYPKNRQEFFLNFTMYATEVSVLNYLKCISSLPKDILLAT